MRFSERPHRVALAVALLASLASTPNARATEEDAQSFFAQGRKLRASGHCEDAIVAFRHALELSPSGIGSLRNIAECEEQLGLLASARIDFWNLRRAAMQSGDPKYVGWDKDAEKAYDRLDARVPRVSVIVESARPSDVRVTIDGKPLDPRLFGTPIERDLGPHVFEASYGGATSAVERVELKPGDRITVRLDAKLPAGAVLSPSAADAPAHAPEGRSAARTAGVVVGSVGLLSLAGAGIALGVRGGALSTVEARCPNYATGTCPPDLESARSRGATASTLVNVLGIAGIAGAAVGTGLVIYGFSSPTRTRSARVFVRPDGGFATAEVKF